MGDAFSIKEGKFFKTAMVESQINIQAVKDKIEYCKKNIMAQQAIIDEATAILNEALRFGLVSEDEI